MRDARNGGWRHIPEIGAIVSVVEAWKAGHEHIRVVGDVDSFWSAAEQLSNDF
jgi:hypothetical protein